MQRAPTTPTHEWLSIIAAGREVFTCRIPAPAMPAILSALLHAAATELSEAISHHQNVQQTPCTKAGNGALSPHCRRIPANPSSLAAPYHTSHVANATIRRGKPNKTRSHI